MIPKMHKFEGKISGNSDYSFRNHSGFSVSVYPRPGVLFPVGIVDVSLDGPTLEVRAHSKSQRIGGEKVGKDFAFDYKGLEIISHSRDHRAGTEAVVAEGVCNGRPVTFTADITYKEGERDGHVKVTLIH